jgi:5-methylcytosine-specific restriction endonuclease McrA
MIQRFNNYKTFQKEERKLFSEVQKRIIACDQKYNCIGVKCKGNVLLPFTWELDHIVPLYQGGTNYYNFYKSDNPTSVNNLQILCPNCHAIKTQQERVTFFECERREKYSTNYKFENASNYYNKFKRIIPQTKVVSPYFKNNTTSNFNNTPNSFIQKRRNMNNNKY